MLRYFAIATVLVVGSAVLAVAWWQHQPHKPLTLKSVNATPIPPHDSNSYANTAQTKPFVAEADWALSVLPECFSPIDLARGPSEYVRAKLPKDAHPLPVPARLVYADCTLEYDGERVVVHRGHDRLTVPPPVTLYRSQDRLYVVRLTGNFSELRAYTPSRL
jgi:hypothetical protein